MIILTETFHNDWVKLLDGWGKGIFWLFALFIVALIVKWID